MVFGWGKKKVKQVPEELPQQREIKLDDVLKITQDLFNLRKTQTLAEVKLLRNNTSPLIKELANIIKTLEKDNLKVEDIDKHLRVIVVRGKKQVIDVIKKDAKDLPDISKFDDIFNLQNILNQKLKKIGDVLGRQTRVIHIFAKKYAEKLKEILEEMNSNNTEIQKLVKNFQETQTDYETIESIMRKIDNLKEVSDKSKQQITNFQENISSLQEKIIKNEESIQKIKSSDEYVEFLKLNQQLSDINDKKIKIKNEIEAQFTKISRPLSRYEYASSLDKEQKSLLSQLLQDPYHAINPKNKDPIIVIFENVRKGILSGSISVKDAEKSSVHITETEELLAEFIKKISNFSDQKNEIQNKINAFDNSDLSDLQRDLDKMSGNKNDLELRISSLKKEIEENQNNIPKLISEIENKIKKFSNTDYSIKDQTKIN